MLPSPLHPSASCDQPWSCRLCSACGWRSRPSLSCLAASLSRLTVAFVVPSCCLFLLSFSLSFSLPFSLPFSLSFVEYDFDWDWLHIMCRGIEVVKDHSHTFAVVAFDSSSSSGCQDNCAWMRVPNFIKFFMLCWATLQRQSSWIKHTVSCRVRSVTLTATHSISEQAFTSINQLSHIWELSSDSNYYKHCS